MVYSIYVDTSLEHCSKGQKIAKYIYCMKITLFLVSSPMLYYLTLLKKPNQKLVNIQTRGDLTKVADEAQ